MKEAYFADWNIGSGLGRGFGASHSCSVSLRALQGEVGNFRLLRSKRGGVGNLRLLISSAVQEGYSVRLRALQGWEVANLRQLS